MISLMTKRHLQKRAKKENKTLPDNYLDVLKKVEERNLPNEIHLKFSWLYKHTQTLDAVSFPSKYILLSTAWAFYFVFYNDGEMQNAFNITIGHELTHKDRDICVLKYNPRYIKFIAYVNESHADFGAAEKMANCSRQKLLDSMEYKKAHKDKDISNLSHPTWTKRIFYAKHYDFGKELIRQIAKDTGCNDQKIIDEVCEHYQEIKLNPPPAGKDEDKII